MGKATREHTNAIFKKQGKPLPYPNDKVEGEEVKEEIREEIKPKEIKRGK